MKTFEVFYTKNPKILTGATSPMLNARQFISVAADSGKFNIRPPEGMLVVSITEILPPITIDNDEKATN